jgi:Uma2 family endonuclease
MTGNPPISNKQPHIPLLRNGDHLTVAEFERRYNAMPEVKKAELIQGVVYMPSPVTAYYHGDQHSVLNWWVVAYQVHTPGVKASDNATQILAVGDNQPQPDVALRILPNYGGQSTINEKGYIVRGTEWTGEISASSISYDLRQKKEMYAQNRVREYMVWRVENEEIDWFLLKAGKYQRMKLKDGLYKSKVFPGLWLDPQAMVASDLTKVLKALQQGIASPEHQRFVEKLQARKK